MLQERFNYFMNLNFDRAVSSEIALAISGGSDSISLLFLTLEWAKNSSIKIVVFTVDHGLRQESKGEIEFIKHLAKDFNLGFVPFKWDHDGSKISIQERAREARYDMMTQKCRELGISTLLTAHHYDDFLENYSMRKEKKSEVLGLSNSYSAFCNNIQILRPLYNTRKENLVSYLEANSISWLEDQSNASDDYERNRIRKKILRLPFEDKRLLEQEVSDINIKAETLNQKFIEEIAKNIEFNNFGFALIKLECYSKIDRELFVYLINYALTVISGKSSVPRYRNIKNIVEKIKQGSDFTRSLHSCILKRIGSSFLIFKEISMIELDDANLDNNIIWDKRFKLNVNNINKVEGYKIGQLDMDSYVEIKKDLKLEQLAKLSLNNHKSILFTLPVIKKLEKIVAIPHISYYNNLSLGSEVKVIFRPNFVSRFTHFL